MAIGPDSTRVPPCLSTWLRCLLDLGPGVAERYGAVEDGSAGCGIRIGAEVAYSLELVARAGDGTRDTRLDEPLLHLQGVRIQVVEVGLAGLYVVRVGLEEEVVVEA